MLDPHSFVLSFACGTILVLAAIVIVLIHRIQQRLRFMRETLKHYSTEKAERGTHGLPD